MFVPPQTLVDHQLRKLIDTEVRSDHDLEERVEAASIDIPVGDRAYLVDKGFAPFRQPTKQLVEKYAIEEFDLAQKTPLYKGHTYFVKALDLALAPHHSARFSPKSSTGRVDLLVKTYIDGFGKGDNFPAGQQGEVWLMVEPQSFNVKLQRGVALNQLRVFDNTKQSYCELDPDEFFLDTHNASSNLYTPPNKYSVSIGVPEDNVGFKAKRTNRFVDLTPDEHGKPRKHAWQDYWERVEGDDGQLLIKKDDFYILNTRELISIPERYSVEMEPMNIEHGELRVHYAGFFDPGFGRPDGASGVLEVRANRDTLATDGLPICDLFFYRNAALPEKAYGEDDTSNYQGQRGAKLAKFFNQPE